MATYGVIKKLAVAAKDVDSLNRSARHASVVVEDGKVFLLETVSTTRNENEVWVATNAASGSLDNLWMVSDFGVIITSSGDYDYKGLNDDPRNYTVAIGEVFSMYKPVTSDVLLMNVEAFTGAKSTHTFANSADGQVQLVWGGSQTSDALSYRYIESTFMFIGAGSSVSNRVIAYKMDCLHN